MTHAKRLDPILGAAAFCFTIVLAGLILLWSFLRPVLK